MSSYALVALGFVALFNTTKFFNFAHGDFLTLGAYLAYTCTATWKLSWPLMLLFIVVVMGVVGLATERLVRRLVQRRALLTCERAVQPLQEQREQNADSYFAFLAGAVVFEWSH